PHIDYDDRYPCNVLFFFQAEDGIRDGHVTGVQTCALPIYAEPPGTPSTDQVTVGVCPPGKVAAYCWVSPGVNGIWAGETSNPVKIGRASCRESVYISVVY